MQAVKNTDNFFKSIFIRKLVHWLSQSYLMSNVKTFIFELPNLF